ncbi:SH3 domain-containing protein [Ancylobacter oerskovii]|uniref:SH3 domain-containing protein n=1 Tax=Ancylobacter oerskovii TaxID=459519 RepID=A0ABW4Z3B8_9HYPH|nr:SH3 domain-containing protein [Ancylobacter oerskovii]MBS7546046.1 hypothetical protein [Ancylobacter oerskovii]
MTTNPQGRSASELSASLVRDYRAMISSLEDTRGEGPQQPAAERAPAAGAAPAQGRTPGQPLIRPLRSAAASPAASAPAAAARPAPLGFAELRSKLSALSDARNILPSRRGAEDSEAGAGASAGASETTADSQAARRRMFGASSRAESAPAPRRRRAASGEAFTWRRLGVLAVCIAALGGAAIALQSVVGREEAHVAPEVIGNAAIAAVAPTAPAPALATPAAEPARVAVVEPAAAAAARLAAPEPISSPPPVLPTISARTLLAPETAEPGPAVPGLTAFAATDPSPLAAAPETHMPRQAPLPPPAPRYAAAATLSAAPSPAAPKPAPAAKPAAVQTAAAPAAQVEADGETADATTGADPTGAATIRSPVTMRTGPNKGAAAMQTLKSGQQVELVSCSSWCEVVADGKRGFVYKSFVSAGAPKEADASTTE